MTAEGLIERMRAAGVRVILGPKLVFPEDVTPDDRQAITAYCREYRDAVMEAFPPEAPKTLFDGPCGRCGAHVTTYEGETAEHVYRACRMSGTGSILCPFWHRNAAADWEDATRAKFRPTPRGNRWVTEPLKPKKEGRKR